MKKVTTTRKRNKKPYIEDIVQAPPVRSISLANAFPEVATLWYCKKNCGFNPEDFSYGSSVKCWFKCPKGPDHIFQVSILCMTRAARNNFSSLGCGFCRGLQISVTNSLANKFPRIACEWSKKNKLSANQVSYGSNKSAWWRCSKGHKWRAIIVNRTGNDSGCPTCNNGITTNLRDYPNVLKEFDHKKNKGIDPLALPIHGKFWWICAANKKHKWQSGFYRTTKSKRCPFCTNRRVSAENNLSRLFPKLAKQWHPSKNLDKRAKDFTPGSYHRVWWKCSKGPDHEWQTKIIDRVRYKTGCPFCSFRKSSVTNIIATQAPHLVKEWHPRKNGSVTPDQERTHSTIKRWWLCSVCSHQWQAEPRCRVVLGQGCPVCSRYKNRRKVKNYGGRIK